MARTNHDNRVTGLHLETARRAWVAAMGTSLEAEAKAYLVELIQRAKVQR